MKIVKMILAGLWGGCLGVAISQFVSADDWGMVCLTIGIFLIVIYLLLWMIDIHFDE